MNVLAMDAFGLQRYAKGRVECLPLSRTGRISVIPTHWRCSCPGLCCQSRDRHIWQVWDTRRGGITATPAPSHKHSRQCGLGTPFREGGAHYASKLDDSRTESHPLLLHTRLSQQEGTETEGAAMASLTSHPWQDLLPNSTTGFILLAIALLVARNAITRTLRWHRLRHVPGPAICGWTSLWLTWQYYQGTIQYRTEDFFEKYGTATR